MHLGIIRLVKLFIHFFYMNKLLHSSSRGNKSPLCELISCLPTLKSSKASPLHKGCKGNLYEESLPRSKEIRPHMKVVCPFDPMEMTDVAWSLRQTTSKSFQGRYPRKITHQCSSTMDHDQKLRYRHAPSSKILCAHSQEALSFAAVP
jgi:hypothetical protein